MSATESYVCDPDGRWRWSFRNIPNVHTCSTCRLSFGGVTEAQVERERAEHDARCPTPMVRAKQRTR